MPNESLNNRFFLWICVPLDKMNHLYETNEEKQTISLFCLPYFDSAINTTCKYVSIIKQLLRYDAFDLSFVTILNLIILDYFKLLLLSHRLQKQSHYIFHWAFFFTFVSNPFLWNSRILPFIRPTEIIWSSLEKLWHVKLSYLLK